MTKLLKCWHFKMKHTEEAKKKRTATVVWCPSFVFYVCWARALIFPAQRNHHQDINTLIQMTYICCQHKRKNRAHSNFHANTVTCNSRWFLIGEKRIKFCFFFSRLKENIVKFLHLIWPLAVFSSSYFRDPLQNKIVIQFKMSHVIYGENNSIHFSYAFAVWKMFRNTKLMSIQNKTYYPQRKKTQKQEENKRFTSSFCNVASNNYSENKIQKIKHRKQNNSLSFKV